MVPRVRVATVLTLLAIVLGGCLPGGQLPGQAPSRGGTLRLTTGALPKLFHPYPEAQVHTGPHSEAWALMGVGLISLDYDKLDWAADPRQDLATQLPTISNNGRTFRFTLRDNAKWSDGRPITTADFVFAYENAIKEENNYVGWDTLVERIESFRAIDPRTLEVTLKETFARFLAIQDASSIGPVPRHVWEGRPWLDPQGNPELLKPTVVGGPWLPKDLGAERHVFTRNPNWWGKQPNIDEIEFVQAGPQVALDLLNTKQVEWVSGFPSSQFTQAKGIPHANVLEWTGAKGLYRLIRFNLQRPGLSDKRVREALVRAISRDDMIQFEEGLAVPQIGLMPQGNTRWLASNLERYDLNLSRARELLQQAGYRLEAGALRDSAGRPVRFEIIYPVTSPARGKMATYIQQQWKELGIETTVTGMEFLAYVDKYQRQRDFDVSMDSLGGGSIDPDVIESQIKTGGTQNAGGYSNPRVDELLKLGPVELDDGKRKQIYDEIQRIVVDDLPVYYLLTLKSFTAFDKKVQGVFPRKGGDILTENNAQVLDWSIAQ